MKQCGDGLAAFSRQEVEGAAGSAGIHDFEPDLTEIEHFADVIRGKVSVLPLPNITISGVSSSMAVTCGSARESVLSGNRPSMTASGVMMIFVE